MAMEEAKAVVAVLTARAAATLARAATERAMLVQGVMDRAVRVATAAVAEAAWAAEGEEDAWVADEAAVWAAAAEAWVTVAGLEAAEAKVGAAVTKVQGVGGDEGAEKRAEEG